MGDLIFLALQEWGLANALTLLSYIVALLAFFSPDEVLHHHLDELI